MDDRAADVVAERCGVDARPSRANGWWAITQAVSVHPRAARLAGLDDGTVRRSGALVRTEWEFLGETAHSLPGDPGDGLLRFRVTLYPLSGGSVTLDDLGRLTAMSVTAPDEICLTALCGIHARLVAAFSSGADPHAVVDACATVSVDRHEPPWPTAYPQPG